MNHRFEKVLDGCSVSGICCESGRRINGEQIIESIALMHERANGLGGGFAGYGIYPEHKEFYALHLMYYDEKSRQLTEDILRENLHVECSEEIPIRHNKGIENPPALHRYFCQPTEGTLARNGYDEGDYMVKLVMRINNDVPGAFVFSSGKNMGAFKAVGYPEDVGDFYRLDEYKGYTWLAHGRFPTNTPGWWAGAHPFTLLDWAIVHNGEISSYGINKRYVEMFNYHCTMMTDTEVTAYMFDLLIRKHKLPLEVACMALAPPFWDDIDKMPEQERQLAQNVRMVYGSALLNGPFSFIMGFQGGMIGLNDRIKLRPLIAARKSDMLFLSSEESAIRVICPHPEKVWAPKAGEPVIGRIREGVS